MQAHNAGVWSLEDRGVSIGISGFQDSYSGLKKAFYGPALNIIVLFADRRRIITECLGFNEPTGPTTPRLILR